MEVTEKRVTWAELFFDLVYVFAVTEVSSLLHAHHSWAGVLRALIVFVPIYWSWVGTSVIANTQDLTSASSRIGIFSVGLAGMFMALAVPDAYGERGVLLGCGMVDPAIFGFVREKQPAYNPQKISGFAFGMGLDRIAMMKYGISDISLLYSGDVRFLEQFA